MKKLLTLFLFTLVAFNLKAQVTTNTNLYELVDPDQQNVDLLYGKNKRSFKGSPFYDEDWKTGYIILNNGDKFTDILIRYDVSNDDVWYMKNADNIIIVDKVDIKNFGWNNEEEHLQFEKCFIASRPQFMEVVYVDDNFQIYKNLNKKLNKKDDSASNSYNTDILDEYVWEKPQLYQNKNNKLVKISSKDKEFFLIFGEQKNAIQKFAKSNKLKIKRKEDLEEIFAHYYTLVH